MAEQQKSDAMKAAEARGFATNPQGGKNPQPGQAQPGQQTAGSTQPGRQTQQASQQTQRKFSLSQAVKDQGKQKQPDTVPGSQVGPQSHQTAARVMGDRSRSLAHTVMLGGNLADLQDIYTAIRDGNYFTAAQRCVSLLNSLLNPGTTGPGELTPGRNVVRAGAMRPATPGMLSDEDTDKVKGMLAQLQDWSEHTKGNPAAQQVRSAEDTPQRITAGSVATLLELIFQLIGQFRSGQ